MERSLALSIIYQRRALLAVSSYGLSICPSPTGVHFGIFRSNLYIIFYLTQPQQAKSRFWKFFKDYTILWRKRTMHPEKIHFPLPTPGPSQEWDAFFLLPSIHALFESVYGKKKKKALPLLHCARSGKREMYFFWAHCPFSPHGGTISRERAVV